MDKELQISAWSKRSTPKKGRSFVFKRTFLLFSGLSMFSGLVWAGLTNEEFEEKLEKITRQTRRPTVSEVLSTISPAAPRDFLAHLVKRRGALPNGVSRQEIEQAGKILVKMERAYPGAVFAPLGRDSANFGDTLDALYTAMGHPGRVKRVDLSGASFTGKSSDIVKFFRDQLGYEMSPKGLEGKPPLVLFDCTGYSGSGLSTVKFGSQSHNILNALYAAYEKAGGRRQDLIRKINFIGTNGRIKDFTGDPGSYFKDLLKAYKKNPKQLGPSYLLPLTFPTHGNVWHNTWSKIHVGRSGEVQTTPGRASPKETRELLLSSVLAAFVSADTDGFRETMNRKFAAAGVSLRAVSKKDMKAPSLFMAFQDLSSRSSEPDLSRSDLKRVFIAIEGLKEFQPSDKNMAILLALQSLEDAYQSKKLYREEALELLGVLIGAMDFTERKSKEFYLFIEKLQKTVTESRFLSLALSKGEVFESQCEVALRARATRRAELLRNTRENYQNLTKTLLKLK